MIVGLILLAAAELKGYRLAPLPPGSPLPRLLVVVEAEALLALWLFCGGLTRYAWVACACLFTVFAVYAAWQLLGGGSSCGCFGSLAVPPAATLAVDLSVLAALYACRPARETSTVVWRMGLPLLVNAVIGPPLAVSMSSYRPVGLSSNGGTVTLAPAAWTGRPLPIPDHIIIGADLTADGPWWGRWASPAAATAPPAADSRGNFSSRHGAGANFVTVDGTVCRVTWDADHAVLLGRHGVGGENLDEAVDLEQRPAGNVRYMPFFTGLLCRSHAPPPWQFLYRSTAMRISRSSLLAFATALIMVQTSPLSGQVPGTCTNASPLQSFKCLNKIHCVSASCISLLTSQTCSGVTYTRWMVSNERKSGTCVGNATAYAGCEYANCTTFVCAAGHAVLGQHPSQDLCTGIDSTCPIVRTKNNSCPR